jgi:hypothetical protein
VQRHAQRHRNVQQERNKILGSYSGRLRGISVFYVVSEKNWRSIFKGGIQKELYLVSI